MHFRVAEIGHGGDRMGGARRYPATQAIASGHDPTPLALEIGASPAFYDWDGMFSGLQAGAGRWSIAAWGNPLALLDVDDDRRAGIVVAADHA